jgi:hypothetical protein
VKEVMITVTTTDSILEKYPPTLKFTDLVGRMPDWTHAVMANTISRTYKFLI